MKLHNVYKYPHADQILWELLQERTPEQSISHKDMPTWERHCLFISSYPYISWYLIETDEGIVGSIYLTNLDEIGIFIFKEYHGKGYAAEAIQLLMKTHPRDQFLANINPSNFKSESLFKKLGFKHIQNTYSYGS